MAVPRQSISVLVVALTSLAWLFFAHNGREVLASENLSLGDYVWQDLNGNGIQEPGEPGLAGIEVQIFKIGTTGFFQPPQVTGSDGRYQFDNLPQGYYKLRFKIPSHMSEWDFSAPLQGTDPALDSDAVPDPADSKIGEIHGIHLLYSNDLDRDAGLNYLQQCNQSYLGLELGDRIWRDRNANGTWDFGETGIAGVEIELWYYVPLMFPPGGDKNTGRVTRTSSTGYYSFDCLPEQENYYLVLNDMDNFKPTSPYKGANDD